MRIGIDARMLGSRHGGIGRYVLELAKNLLQQDSVNSYFIFYNLKNCDFADIDLLKKFQNAELVSTNIRHYSFGEQLNFHTILNKYNLDLVHFPNFNVPLLYKKPYVVTIHDMVHHKIGGVKKSHFFHFQAYKKIIQNAANKAIKIITVSDYSKNDIIKYLNESSEKIEVIYEGVNLKLDITDQQVAEVKRKYFLHKPYFLFVGVLERKKNTVNLSRGFDLFMKTYGLDMDLVFAGRADSNYPEARHKILDIKNNNHLVLTGHISDLDLAALYKGAYAFVSASLHEGFGLPGVEAMNFGLPLAVSNTPVFNEIYDNAAIYFDTLNVEDISSKLYLLARDQSFYAQIRKHSLERAPLFSWQKCANETLEIYRKALVL